MKKLLLLAICMTGLTTATQAQIASNPPSDLTACDTNNDGFAAFNLSMNTLPVLGNLSPNLYMVSYHLTQSDAQNDLVPLQTPYMNATAFQQTLFARVTEIANPTNYVIYSFDLLTQGITIVTPEPLKSCAREWPNNQLSYFDLTLKDEEITNGQPGYTVKYYTPNNVLIVNPQHFSSGAQTINAVVTSPGGCTATTSLSLELLPLPSVPNFPDIVSCNGAFDLTQYNYLLEPNTTIKFYPSSGDAWSDINEITNPENYISGTVVIGLVITSQTTGCSVWTEIWIIETEDYQPLGFDGSNAACVDYVTGEVYYSTHTEVNLNPAEYTFSWMKDGVLIDGANTPELDFTSGGVYSFTAVNNITGCVLSDDVNVYQSSPPVTIGSGLSITDDTITVTVEAYGPIVYRIDGAAWQESNVFSNIPPGNHTIGVMSHCGDIVDFNCLIITMAPNGISEQTFTQGDTLADLEVEGENILWYDNDGEMPNFPDGMDEPLPLTTVLTDGTTYYASQTINGIESTQRLGVTVNLVLGVNENIFATLQYYPNPATGILNIDNTNTIDAVTIANALGQKVFGKIINSNNAQVDVSSLSNGIYFVTATSGSTSKTIKVIKE